MMSVLLTTLGSLVLIGLIAIAVAIDNAKTRRTK